MPFTTVDDLKRVEKELVHSGAMEQEWINSARVAFASSKPPGFDAWLMSHNMTLAPKAFPTSAQARSAAIALIDMACRGATIRDSICKELIELIEALVGTRVYIVQTERYKCFHCDAMHIRCAAAAKVAVASMNARVTLDWLSLLPPPPQSFPAKGVAPPARSPA